MADNNTTPPSGTQNPLNDVELFQQFCIRYINKRVRNHFSDIDNLLDDGLDTSNLRHVARVVCTHKDNDPISLTNSRLITFGIILGDSNDFSELLNAIDAGKENKHITRDRRNRPQISLNFLEDIQDIDIGYQRLKGKINFRLMNETSESITKAELTTIAGRIKTAFATGSGFVWRKGKLMCSYSDWDRGYQLQLLCRDKAEGKRVVEQVLDIQLHTPDWQYFQTSENEEPSQAFPTIPANQTILGKAGKEERSRPICDVRFKFAQAMVGNRIVRLVNSGISSRQKPLVD